MDPGLGILDFVLERLAGGKPGDKTRAFFSSVKKFGALFIAAKGITFLLQIAAGRILGPEEFGRANLVIFAASLMMIPILAGLPTGVVKFVSMEDDPERQSEFLSTAFLFFIPWGIFWIFIFYFSRNPVCRLLGFDHALYRASLPFAFFLCCYTLGASSLQALKRFRAAGLMEFSYALAFLILFIALLFLKPPDFRVFIRANIGAYLIGIAAFLYFAPGAARLVFVWKRMRALASYMAAPALWALAAGAVSGILPIVLASAFPARSVGFYSIYETGSINIASVAAIILASVLAPLSSRSEDWEGAFKRLMKSAPAIIALGVVSFAASIAMVVRLVGPRYPLDFIWLALFAVAAALCLFWSLMAALLAMEGTSGLWIVARASLLAAAAALTFGFLFIPKLGVRGLALSLIVFYALGAALALLRRAKIQA